MNFESVLLYNKFYLIKKDNFGRVLLDRGDNLKNKIEILIKKLNVGLIEREEQIKMALLAAISGENILFIGPPGTGKSVLSRRITNVFSNVDYFEYLLTKFTTPEELFGPISIKELENDKFHRNIEGYLTDSEIVFLDEVFKANSAILNSLLTIMNERIYHNGYQKENIRTKIVIGASNELPREEYELDALYDRFLFREKINYIENTKLLFNTVEEIPIILENEKIEKQELESLNNLVNTIVISDSIIEKIIKIKEKIQERFGNFELISDRRIVKVIKVLKIAALSSGRNKLVVFDLLLLNYLFWKNEENIQEIREIIKDEILDIGFLNIEKLNSLYEKWNTHFNSFFKEQKKDDEGNLCYFDINKNITLDKKGSIHIKDSMGHYIFYKGFREHVKISLELGKFDHGYIDSGIRTLDKKIVWKYEFSPIEVVSNFNNILEGYEKLTIEGIHEPIMIDSFEEYFKYYKKNKVEYISLFKEILKNITFEMEKVKSIYNDLILKREYLVSEENNILWIPRKDLIDIKNSINIKISEVEKLNLSYSTLVFDLEKAING